MTCPFCHRPTGVAVHVCAEMIEATARAGKALPLDAVLPCAEAAASAAPAQEIYLLRYPNDSSLYSTMVCESLDEAQEYVAKTTGMFRDGISLIVDGPYVKKE